jgi:hypothetical protein
MILGGIRRKWHSRIDVVTTGSRSPHAESGLKSFVTPVEDAARLWLNILRCQI